MDTENVLFAIAGSESMKAGFGGAIYGYAANQQVLEHYVEKMKATHVGVLHPYQFCVFENEMQEIIKTYTYAYSGEEIIRSIIKGVWAFCSYVFVLQRRPREN